MSVNFSNSGGVRGDKRATAGQAAQPQRSAARRKGSQAGLGHSGRGIFGAAAKTVEDRSGRKTTRGHSGCEYLEDAERVERTEYPGGAPARTDTDTTSTRGDS